LATKEAEVIAAVCANKDVYTIIAEDVELFGAYGDAFEFIKDYYGRYRQVPDAGLVQKEFGALDLPETTAPTKYYLEGLKENFLDAQLRGINDKLAAALDKGNSKKALLEKVQEEVAKLGRYTMVGNDLNIVDLEAAEEHYQAIRKIAQDNGGTPGISTGFKSIDSAYTTGMAPGHFIVIMGYTGRAKTWVSELLAMKAWEQNYKPMIISLEMTPQEQMERIHGLMGSGMWKMSDLARGDINIDDFRTWGKKKFRDQNGFIVPSLEGIAELTPNHIQAKIDTHKPDIVVIDYLQLMKDNAKTQAMTPRMLNLSRELKMLATANNIPIIALTAVTDEDGDKRDGPPVLSQISWSSGIEYDANLAIAIHRIDDSDLVQCVCRKNRHGDMFSFHFEVDFNAGIWKESF
jgi:replicative DNA helicase